MAQVDAGVDDADRDPAAVPGRVRRDERGGAHLADRHVRVVLRRRRARRDLRLRRLARVGVGRRQRDDLVDVRGLHGVDRVDHLGVVDRDLDAQVRHVVVRYWTVAPAASSAATAAAFWPSFAASSSVTVASPFARA